MLVSISCVCVVTDIADRQDNLISCIEYVITKKKVCSLTVIKIKYFIGRALDSAVVYNLIEPFKDETASV